MNKTVDKPHSRIQTLRSWRDNPGTSPLSSFRGGRVRKDGPVSHVPVWSKDAAAQVMAMQRNNWTVAPTGSRPTMAMAERQNSRF